MRTLSPQTRSVLAAALLASSAASALATTPDTDVAALVYAGGEAMAPEAEARLRALTTTPGGALTRDEVQQQWAEARQDGSLLAAGEIAEPQTVLLARSVANERQTRQILASHEAERQRVVALEAQAEAQRQAELQARLAAAVTPAPVASADSGVMAAAALGSTTEPPPASPEPAASTSAAFTESPAPTPDDAPPQLPLERPFVAPAEVPISRQSELPVEVLIDKD